MTITLSPTNEWITIDDVPCRMWDGTTESGINIQAAIARLAPHAETPENIKEFLLECEQAGLRSPTHPVSKAQDIRDVVNCIACGVKIEVGTYCEGCGEASWKQQTGAALPKIKDTEL